MQAGKGKADLWCAETELPIIAIAPCKCLATVRDCNGVARPTRHVQDRLLTRLTVNDHGEGQIIEKQGKHRTSRRYLCVKTVNVSRLILAAPIARAELPCRMENSACACN
jgi:hypothetical protein